PEQEQICRGSCPFATTLRKRDRPRQAQYAFSARGSCRKCRLLKRLSRFCRCLDEVFEAEAHQAPYAFVPPVNSCYPLPVLNAAWVVSVSLSLQTAPSAP